MSKFKIGDPVVIIYPNHPSTGKAGIIIEASKSGHSFTIQFDDRVERWCDDDRFFEYSRIFNSPLWKALS